ncbi:molybdopterin-guanine dinucleotide biosynthesis protein B [Acetobacterium bakii]|uniref:Molybdopterin-guanine dinucleotide biosynthesis protein B n=2 Tax=Acetobacterium bakii TaxID=52689 RepID=A0A0L6U4E7_9FIRM|nr:molybdopterin-guanine dinucleotide biosynthesis protein B [Acetobacterium bakii]
MENMMNTPKLLAISGVKNSGKTTLITKLIPELVKLDLKIATIKHDGHGFSADHEDTDTYRHKASGAYGTAVFSNTKYMLVKDMPQCNEAMLIQSFPEADLILLEGFKLSGYPKIEIIRSGNSQTSVCDADTLIAMVTDLPLMAKSEVPVFGLNDIDLIAQFVYEWTCEK